MPTSRPLVDAAGWLQRTPGTYVEPPSCAFAQGNRAHGLVAVKIGQDAADCDRIVLPLPLPHPARVELDAPQAADALRGPATQAAAERGRARTQAHGETSHPAAAAARGPRTPSPRGEGVQGSWHASPGESLPALSPPSSTASEASSADEIEPIGGPHVHLCTEGSRLPWVAKLAQSSGARSNIDDPATLRAPVQPGATTATFEVTDAAALGAILQASLRGRVADRLRRLDARTRANSLEQRRRCFGQRSFAAELASSLRHAGQPTGADQAEPRPMDAWDEASFPTPVQVDRYFGKGGGVPADCLAQAPSLRHRLGLWSVQRKVRRLFDNTRGLLSTAIVRQTGGDQRWATQLAAVAAVDSFADLRATLNVDGGAGLRVGGLPVALPRPNAAAARFVVLCAEADGGHSVELGTLWPRQVARLSVQGSLASVEVEGQTYVGARLRVGAPVFGRVPIELTELWLASDAVSRPRDCRAPMTTAAGASDLAWRPSSR